MMQLATIALLLAYAGPMPTLGQKPVLIDLPFNSADVELEHQKPVVVSQDDYFALRSFLRLLKRDGLVQYYPWLLFYHHYYGSGELKRMQAFAALRDTDPIAYIRWLDSAAKDTYQLLVGSTDTENGKMACPSSQSRQGVGHIVEGGGGPHDYGNLSFVVVSADFGIPLVPLDAEAFNPDNEKVERLEVRQAGLGAKWRLHVSAPGVVFYGCRPFRLVDEDADMPDTANQSRLPQAVLVDRGNCSFHEKASHAAAAGATAILIADSPRRQQQDGDSGEGDKDEDARLMPMGSPPEGTLPNLDKLLAVMISSTTADKLRLLERTRTTPRPLVVQLTQHAFGFKQNDFFQLWPKLIEIERQMTVLTYGWHAEEKELDGNASFARGENAASASSSMDSLLKTRLDLLRRIYRPIQDIYLEAFCSTQEGVTSRPKSIGAAELQNFTRSTPLQVANYITVRNQRWRSADRFSATQGRYERLWFARTDDGDVADVVGTSNASVRVDIPVGVDAVADSVAINNDSTQRRRIVFCPPVSKRKWNGNTARFGQGGGISGSHTQVLYLAEGLAKMEDRWDVTIAGGVLEPADGERINGVRYVEDLGGEAIQEKVSEGGEETFDIVVSDFGLRNYERVRARHVVFIMGLQTLKNQWTMRMYLEQQRQAHAWTRHAGQPSCSGFAVTFVHRAPWSYRVFMRESMLEFAYANHVVGFHAGVDIGVIATAKKRNAAATRVAGGAPKPDSQRRRGGSLAPPPRPRAVPRRMPRSVIFHALPERGGAMAARIFNALNWTDGSMDFYAYEDQVNADMAFIASLASLDGRIQIRGSLSKAALFSILRGTDYFFYPVTSRHGMIHKDTFANVVAEALALGVIVVAPRVAALPEIYSEHVHFVDPPTCPHDYTLHGAASNVDFAYSDEAMLEAYVAVVRRIEADPEQKEYRREIAGAWARRTFTWAESTRRFHGDVLEEGMVSSACFENVQRPPPIRGAFVETAAGLAAPEKF